MIQDLQLDQQMPYLSTKQRSKTVKCYLQGAERLSQSIGNSVSTNPPLDNKDSTKTFSDKEHRKGALWEDSN